MDILMVVGVQQAGDRLMVACTRYSGDNLDTGAIYSGMANARETDTRKS